MLFSCFDTAGQMLYCEDWSGANDRSHIFSSVCNTPATKTTIDNNFVIELVCVVRKWTQRAQLQGRCINE